MKLPKLDNNKKEGLFLVFAICFLIVLIFVMNISNIKLVCIFNHLTGFLCPGCGTTRMLKSLFKLDIKQAFLYNPLVFCLLPFIGLYFVERIYVLLFNKISFIPTKISNLFWRGALIVTILFGVLRNISIFDFLRP